MACRTWEWKPSLFADQTPYPYPKTNDEKGSTMNNSKTKSTTKKRKPAPPRVKLIPKIEVAIKGWYCDSRYSTDTARGEGQTYTGYVKDGKISLTTGCGSHRATFNVDDLAKLVEVARANPTITMEG